MPESRHRRRRGRVLPRGRSAGSLSTPGSKRRTTNKLYLVASAVIAVLVIAGFALGGIGVGSNSGSQPIPRGKYHQFQEGIGIQQLLMPTGSHVPEGQTVEYSTVPPTSGDHWSQWTECGFYPEGLPDERITHNLEHGIIVVNYNLETADEVGILRDTVEDIELYEDWGLIRFYPRISVGTVSLSAWGVLDTMSDIDHDRIDRFFNAYAGNLGPEEIPCSINPLPMDRQLGG